MKNSFLVLALAGCMALSHGAPALAGDAEAVKADVQRIAEAVYGYDVETVVDYTYPKVLEMMGGEEQMRILLTSAFEQVKTMGITLESFTFPADPTFVTGESREYVIVPTDSVMAAEGQKIRSVNFQFGIREKGEQKWTYLEGSRVDEGILKTLFHDFPLDYAFPETSQEPM